MIRDFKELRFLMTDKKQSELILENFIHEMLDENQLILIKTSEKTNRKFCGITSRIEFKAKDELSLLK